MMLTGTPTLSLLRNHATPSSRQQEIVRLAQGAKNVEGQTEPHVSSQNRGDALVAHVLEEGRVEEQLAQRRQQPLHNRVARARPNLLAERAERAGVRRDDRRIERGTEFGETRGGGKSRSGHHGGEEEGAGGGERGRVDDQNVLVSRNDENGGKEREVVLEGERGGGGDEVAVRDEDGAGIYVVDDNRGTVSHFGG